LAVEYGLKNPKKAMKIAENLNVEKMGKRSRKNKVLPLSCSESAKSLERDRSYYEVDGVFPKRVIDGIISKLESYKDGNLQKKMTNNPEKTEELLSGYLNCG